MNRQNVNQAYENLIARLHAVRRQWWWLTFSEGFLKCVGILTLVMVGVLVILNFSFQVRQVPFLLWGRIGILLLSTAITVYIVIRSLIIPLSKRFTDAAVASRLELTQGESELASENRILSAVQLWKNLTENRLGYAPEFIEHLIIQTDQDMEHIQRGQVFQTEFRKIKRNAGIAVAGVGLLLITHFLLPNAFNGFAATFQTLPQTLPDSQGNQKKAIQITEIRPGNTQVERGTDVNVAAKVSGHIGAPVTLYYRIGDGNAQTSTVEWQSMPMQRASDQQVPGTASSYHLTLENVTRPLQYYISVEEVASAQYQVTISDEPIVTQFQYRLNYPAYTRLQSQTFPANTGDIQALFGTELVFTGESNKPLQAASLAFEESDNVKLEITARHLLGTTPQPRVDGQGTEANPIPRTMRGSFIAQESGNYRIQITDVEGFTNREPINYTLTVFKDTAPDVNIVTPARDTVLDNAMLVDLKVETTDDYGIQALQLVYRVEAEGAEEVNIPLKRWGVENVPVRRSVSVAYRWDVDRIGIFPGEVLAYYVQALDNDDVSGPNIGKSPTYTLRFPSLSELYDSVATTQETEQQGLEDLVDEQADATGLIDTLLGKIRKSQELTFNDENLMQQVFENQKEIEQAAKQLVEDMQQTAEDMEQKQLFDTETIQKYQELQELMEQALSEEHKEILRKLSEALAKQQVSEQERAMMEANLSQEQFLQQLERAKSLYEQILLQQELEAAAKQAQALADQQKALMDTLETSAESAPANELAQKEDRVGEEFGKLSEQLDELGADMGELAENKENAPPQIERLADEVKRLNQFAKDQNLPEDLEATSENLRSGQNREALESGREAEQTLTELAQGLDNALEFMEGANANETLTAMREAVKSGLHLSHLHEEVLSKTNDLIIAGQTETYITNEILQLQNLAADELSTAEGLTQLANKLWELGNRQMEVPPKVVWHLNASKDALSRAARALEDRQPSLALPIQRTALADLNQAIFELLDAMAQMNQQMGASGMENMLEQLQQLAQSQEQLNQMAQNLSQQMREQGQTPGFEQMMRQLAAQQQLIREATERLAERAEQMAQMLGSLEDVAGEMTEVEQSLRQGELDEQVLNRQEQILTRMLDSLKSLQKRDVGKQRKAEVAEKPETPAQEVPPLHPELLEIVQKLEATPHAKELEDIPFQYREQLRRYFKALSQKTQ
ncbi:hypothetical protein F4009_03640 [Candidatus Poribacteria bacterium]|nr:hypothetical protein [Candidatus Poribacteria bacterium]MYK93091.1 hypothetical protein [Candidatus Poribacteria bacterium]